QHPAFQVQTDQIRLLIASPLPRPQLARSQQNQRQVAWPQRVVGGILAHGALASVSLLRMKTSRGRLLSLAPGPPPRGRWSSGESRTSLSRSNKGWSVGRCQE